jgi:hypothetical protein
MIPGNPVHAIALLPGDDVHLAPHTVGGTDIEGHHWERRVECAEADVHVDRVRETDGPDLVALYWWLGTMTGVTVYGRTGLVPLLRRVA